MLFKTILKNQNKKTNQMAQLISCTVYPVNGGTIGTQLLSVPNMKRVYAATRAENAAIVTAIEMMPSGLQTSSSVYYTNTAVSTVLSSANA